MRKKNSPNSKPGEKVLKWIGIISAIIGLILGISQVSRLYSNWREKDEKVSSIMEDVRLLIASEDYAGAWRNLDEAIAVKPESEEVKSKQADVAMQWLRNIRLSSARGENKFADIVNKLLPALYHSINNTTGREQADIIAHIGWANYLKFKDGERDLKIEENFKQAIGKDSGNVYAHAMWGFWLLYPQGKSNVTEAEEHFTTALKSSREQKYVRGLRLSAWRNYYDNSLSAPKILVAVNEMRKHNDTLEIDVRERVLSGVYYSEKDIIDSISAILPPKDHLETFLYLTGDIEINAKPYLRFAHAQLVEKTGDKSKALGMYQSIYSDSDLKYYTRREDVKEAIARCSR